MENWSNFYRQMHSQINGRNVWFYLVATPIGDIQIVQYEEKEQYITTFLFYNDYEKAEKKYQSICSRIVSGKL